MASKHQRGRPSTHSAHSPLNGSGPDSSEISAHPDTRPEEIQPQVFRVCREEGQRAEETEPRVYRVDRAEGQLPEEIEPSVYALDHAEGHLKVSEASLEYLSSLSLRLSTELSARLLLAAFARRWAPEVLAAKLLTRGLDQEPDRIRAEAAIKILTPREREVTRLTALGKTNHEIAYELGIARETVKSHIRSTLAKLGLHSKPELRLLVQTVDPGLIRTLDPGLVQGPDTGVGQTLDPRIAQGPNPGIAEAPDRKTESSGTAS